MTNNLFEAAYRCIMATDSKVQLSRTTAQAWQNNQLNLSPSKPPAPILSPGLPPSLSLVSAREVPKRTTLSTPMGQAALLHALAHIEFNAINLAWDAIYRFRDLPKAFYDDWVKVADEETTHFLLLHEQLQQLDYVYGDLSAHNGLWEMAVKTAHDVLIRMALVPRVLEARGLDATPPIIAKLQAQKLQTLVEILQLILHDEIGHVAIGSRWFFYCCAERNLVPETTFQRLVAQYFTGDIKPPFNVEARLAAGFSQAELEQFA
ncbi:hypothetical protein PN36_26280 [Candidatus Thiomargarita nelsonii]|uniref:Protein containing DUF455 n=1 Tax=Candidatus Thiomargarita nelsonii TaxID=1003181 RepID=A0A0A6RSF2_9GAMM|nr:hypothetical protein PN36_26280 [Candidatus Thiomargarita nelsonii]